MRKRSEFELLLFKGAAGRQPVRRWAAVAVVRDYWGPTLFILGFAGVIAIKLAMSPWPVGTTLKHWAAAPECSAARAAGLAPARRGQPGYYRRHDRDGDGVACEPYRPRVGSGFRRSG